MALLRGLPGVVLAGLCIGTTAACSLALDFFQCEDNLDCQNTRGTPLVCTNNECVQPPPPEDVACESSDECILALGEGHVCVAADDNCAAITSEVCPTVVEPEDYDPDSTVWLGSILATSSPYDVIGTPLQNSVRLAVEDFNKVARVGGTGVGWIICNSEGSPETATEAAEHLSKIGSPAIVGPMRSEEVLAVAEEVTVEDDILLMTPTATAKSLTDLDDEGLVWRPISSDVHQAAALVDLISILAPQAQKVALLVKNDDYGNGILGDVTEPLSVRLPPGGLVTLKFSDPAEFNSNDALLSQYVDRITTASDAEPDTVALVGTSEVRELILLYLETWSAIDADDRPPLPRFIVTHGGISVMESTVESVAEGFRPVLMPNMLGISPEITDDENFSQFRSRYNLRFDDAPMNTALAYDSAMVVMMAMSAAEDEITGTTVADAIARLANPEGEVIRFGGAGVQFVSNTVGALADGEDVNVTGVSGPLDFDLATGQVRTDLIGYGLQPAGGDDTVPALFIQRRYELDDPPAASGSWVDE